MSEERFCKVGEVAHVLGVDDRTVWRLVQRGELAHPVRVGRCTRWPSSDVEAYITRLKRERGT